MKRLMILGLLFVSTLTLSACDLLGGDINEVIDNARNIAETFTMEDQTIEIGTENYDWAAYVVEINENLPENINIEVVEDTIQYGVPGTYTVTLRLTAPEIDFTHTFNVTVVEGGLSPEEILAGFDGDFTYLQTFMDPIMNSDAKETVTTIIMNIDEMDFETGEMVERQYTMVSRSKIVLGEEIDLLSRKITINAAGQATTIEFFVERMDTALSIYMNSDFLIESIDDEEVIQELGLDQDYFVYVIEGDFTSEEDLDYSQVLGGLLGYLDSLTMELSEDEQIYVEEQIGYILENLSLFEKYGSLEYYMNQEGMTLDLFVNSDDQVEMQMLMDTTMYGAVLDDFVSDLELFAAGLDDVILPDIKAMPEYQQLLTILSGLQPMQLDAMYDPSNPTELAFQIDLTTFMNTLAMLASGGGMMNPPVNQMTIDVVVRDGAEVVLPESATDLNQVIDDVAKVYIMQEFFSLSTTLIDQAEESANNPLYAENEVSLVELNELYGESLSNLEAVIDVSTSYIVNRGTLDAPDYYMYFYWNDGQAVFVEEVSIDFLEELVFMSTSITPIIELVNDQAFDLEKLINFME